MKEGNGVSERLVDSGEGVHNCCSWGEGKEEQADFSHVETRHVRSVWATDEITNVHITSFY